MRALLAAALLLPASTLGIAAPAAAETGFCTDNDTGFGSIGVQCLLICPSPTPEPSFAIVAVMGGAILGVPTVSGSNSCGEASCTLVFACSGFSDIFHTGQGECEGHNGSGVLVNIILSCAAMNSCSDTCDVAPSGRSHAPSADPATILPGDSLCAPDGGCLAILPFSVNAFRSSDGTRLAFQCAADACAALPYI